MRDHDYFHGGYLGHADEEKVFVDLCDVLRHELSVLDSIRFWFHLTQFQLYNAINNPTGQKWLQACKLLASEKSPRVMVRLLVIVRPLTNMKPIDSKVICRKR
jgi:hypothetical protein